MDFQGFLLHELTQIVKLYYCFFQLYAKDLYI